MGKQKYDYASYIGKKFNRWTILALGKKDIHGDQFFICECECGTKKESRARLVINGESKSCGCLHREVVAENNKKQFSKHNLSNSRLWSVWAGMKNRCNNHNDDSYKNYGGRGIKVCDEWQHNFKSFYDWAISNGYKEDVGLSLDRINNNGNYEPTNCRWATTKIQGNNKRNNRMITINGKTKTLQQWADELEINSETLMYRFNKNYTGEKLIQKEKIKCTTEHAEMLRTLSKKHNIPYEVLQSRYKNGDRDERLVRKYIPRNKKET